MLWEINTLALIMIVGLNALEDTCQEIEGTENCMSITHEYFVMPPSASVATELGNVGRHPVFEGSILRTKLEMGKVIILDISAMDTWETI